MDEAPTDAEFYALGYSVVPHIGDKYACYVLSYAGGATLKWFRDSFAEKEREEADKKGENVYKNLDDAMPSSPTGILVMPYFAGAATPFMDTSAKASFVGLTFEHTKLDIYRALMEGTSYEVINYVHFAFPVIGDLLMFPVKGETRTLGKVYNY